MRDDELQQCKEKLAQMESDIKELSDRIRRMEDTMAKESIPEQMDKKQPIKSWYMRQRTTIKDSKHTMPQHKANNLEGRVGRNLFAVLASLLILIGVGIFVASIYEAIPVVVKVGVIYLFGLGLIGGSLVIYKTRKNKFWLGVTSCGAGELLVSIIASYVHFQIISLITTYFLILVWIFAVLILTKVHTPLFKIISYLGFIVSMIFGMATLTAKDGVMFIALFISYVGISLFFVLSHRGMHAINLGMLYCSTIFLLMFHSETFYFSYGAAPIDLSVFVVIIAIVFHAIHLFCLKKWKVSYSLYSCLTFILVWSAMGDIRSDMFHCIMVVVSMILWILNLHKYGANKVNAIFSAFNIVAMFIINLICIGSPDIQAVNTGLILIVPIVFFVAFYNKTNDHCSIIAAIIYFIFFMVAENEAHSVTCSIVAFLLFLVTKRKNRGGQVYKNIWYALFAFCFVYVFDFIADAIFDANIGIPDYPSMLIKKTLSSVLICILTGMNLYRLYKEEVSQYGYRPSFNLIALHVFNGILLFSGMDILMSNLDYDVPSAAQVWMVNKGIILFLLIASTMALLAFSIIHSIKTHWSNQILTMFHCVKFTIYFWMLSSIFTADTIIISILLLILAIASIIVGFALGSRAARIYGLALSLVCSVGLVFSSMSFNSSLKIAGGIIMCGALCFVISFIYSRAEKMFSKKTESETEENLNSLKIKKE